MRTLLLPYLGLALFTAASGAAPLPKVLLFANPMKSDNDVIRRTDPKQLSVAERHFRALSEGVFEVTITQDGGELGSRAQIERYQVLVFFTAGNPSGVDVDAVVGWVRAGGAFVGIHSSANTYQRHPGYGEMLGARYDRRPWRTAAAPQTRVRIKVDAPANPIVQSFPGVFEFADDIYQFKDFDREKVTLLLSLDRTSLDLAEPKLDRDDAVFPMAWSKSYGRGRVFYTALGDWEPTWSDPRYRAHLIAGIRWTLRSRETSSSN